MWFNTWGLIATVCEGVFWFYVICTISGCCWFLWLHLVDHTLEV